MIVVHQDRSIIEISGIERKTFLQGLITNDVNKISKNNLIYSVMLNAQGRFLYDFFIFEKEEILFLDCLNSRRDEILQKFKFYKLRTKVEFKKNDELIVGQDLEGELLQKNPEITTYPDPRSLVLGHRIYFLKSGLSDEALGSGLKPTKDQFQIQDESFYHLLRIKNKIPEGELDLTYEKSFILEFGFDDLNAIDYKKGCYVGQELTARTHHLGEIRKKIIHIVIDKNEAEKQELQKGSKLFSKEDSSSIGNKKPDGKPSGIFLSSVTSGNEVHALILSNLN